MRFYAANKVPGTLSPTPDAGSSDADARAAAAGGRHLFWDVAFGERAPVLGWYDVHPTRSVRHARGFQLNLDAAAFLLLDFDAQSSAVINTDYRIGASVDLRPWRDGWDRLSFSVGVFHQSTHLGDEYVLSARTIQDSGTPVANPALPYRANPSFLAFPGTASVDLSVEALPDLSMRLYLGGTLYAVSGLPQATHPDGRIGAELRYGQPEPADVVAAPSPAFPARGTSRKVSTFLDNAQQFGLGHGAIDDETTRPVSAAPTRGRRLRRGARSYLLAYEVLAQHEYAHNPAAPGQALFVLGDGHWLTQHAMAMLLFNLDTQRSTSNALALSLEFIDGRNQHGQLIEYDAIRTGAFSLSYYW
jgi:hypothetical protein